MLGIDPFTFVMALVIAAIGGFAAAGILRWRQSDYQINRKEFLIGLAVITLVTTPLVSFVGGKIAHGNAVGGYVEYWGGSLIAAQSETIVCTRDGPCIYEYDCDPYEVYEQVGTIQVLTGYDSKGNAIYTSQPVYDWVTHYHSCPVATHEYSYWLSDSFGQDHQVAYHIFAAEPQQWRAGHGISADIPRGVPAAWVEAKQRIEAGDAPPATKSNEYINYFLAAQSSILKTYGGDVEEYRQRQLLVEHTQNHANAIYDGYKAKKVVTAGGLKLSNEAEWQDALSQLNAKLGAQLQGDLHLVVVPSQLVGPAEADRYTGALLAYWQGPEFDKHGFAKNAIVLVVGVDDASRQVVWARSKTGLPVGNGEMMAALSLQLQDKPFDPHSLLGSPKAQIQDGKATYSQSGGLVDKIITTDYPYKRPCMDCKDEGESGGFVYLDSESLISVWAKFWIVVVGAVTAGFVWWFFAWAPLFEPLHPGRRQARRNSDRTFY